MRNFQNFANQVVEVCDSTNDIAKKLAENNFPHGTWISSLAQSLGRGRLGRKWQSSEGNLYLSVILRIEKKKLWSWIPLAIAVGVTNCFKDLFPEIPIKIKWPNDLWVGNAKLGGILCEGSGFQENPFIVAGIGLNCIHSPEDLGRSTTNLTALRGTLTSPDEIRLPIHRDILKQIAFLETHGSSKFISLYNHYAYFTLGSAIEWFSEKTRLIHTGVIHGLGPSGELQVKTPDGELISLLTEEVTVKRL